LRDQLAADFGQMDGDDLARIWGAKRDASLLSTSVEEDGHEQRFARQQSLAGAHEGPEEATLLLGTVTENRLHVDAVVHVHHAAGFRDRRFIGIEFHFDVLHVLAKDLVVDLVHRSHA
jgi:hypothetical protein